MNITTLDQMEKIVSTNSNLRWDGWNVIHLLKSKTAIYKTNGAFVNGNWYIKTIYAPDQSGWKINQKHLES